MIQKLSKYQYVSNLKSQITYFLEIGDCRMSQDSESTISNLKLRIFWRLAISECHKTQSLQSQILNYVFFERLQILGAATSGMILEISDDYHNKKYLSKNL